MPKNRTIYNALALYAGQVNATGMQTGLGDVLQLSRVQSFDEDFTRNFTDSLDGSCPNVSNFTVTY